MRRDDEIRRRPMLEEAREAVSFARGRVRADLETDRQLVLSEEATIPAASCKRYVFKEGWPGSEL